MLSSDFSYRSVFTARCVLVNNDKKKITFISFVLSVLNVWGDYVGNW